MDAAAEAAQLENEKSVIESYLAHPITAKILKDNDDQQQVLIDMLCNNTIIDVATFFGHFESIGHLRGLRRAKALIQDDLEEINAKLEELK